MEISLKKMWQFILKFWWIVVIMAVLGAGLGYFTATEETSTTKYISSAKVILDIDHLDKMEVSSSSGSDNGEYTKYNIAYSLFPTFQDLVLSSEGVLERASDEYNAKHGTDYDANGVKNMLWLEFPGNSLTFTIHCQDEDKDVSYEMCELVAKYGVQRINQFSDDVKMQLSSLYVYTTTVNATVTSENVELIKQRKEDIYNAVKAGLVEKEYLQLVDVEEGLTVSETKVTFVGYDKSVNEKLVKFLITSGLVSADPTAITTSVEKINEIAQMTNVEVVESNLTKNIIVNAILFVIISVIGLCVAQVIVQEKAKKSSTAKAEEKSE